MQADAQEHRNGAQRVEVMSARRRSRRNRGVAHETGFKLHEGFKQADQSQSLRALASVLLQDLGNFGTSDFDPLQVYRRLQNFADESVDSAQFSAPGTTGGIEDCISTLVRRVDIAPLFDEQLERLRMTKERRVKKRRRLLGVLRFQFRARLDQDTDSLGLAGKRRRMQERASARRLLLINVNSAIDALLQRVEVASRSRRPNRGRINGCR
jgi:hypothetical protein